MVRTKLTTAFRAAISKYLGIPYARNEWQNGVLVKESVFGGKADWTDIEYATKCAAEAEGINYQHLTPDSKLKLQKRHKIGIDCSGLAYHLMDELDRLKGGQGILFKVSSVQKISGTYGPRVLSAAELTHPHNAVKVSKYEEIKTGDLIRHHNGTHILIITEYKNQLIKLVHSSKGTVVNGVHYGQIKIVDPSKPLNFQQWSDTTIGGINYNELFNPENFDGIYRLRCFV